MSVSDRATLGLAALSVSLAGLFLIRADVDLAGLPAEFVFVPASIAAAVWLVSVPNMEGHRARVAKTVGLGLGVLALAALVLVVFHEGEAQRPIVADLAGPIALGGLVVLAAAPWLAVDRLASCLWPSWARPLAWSPIAIVALLAVGLFLVEVSRLLRFGLPSDANEVFGVFLWLALVLGVLVTGALSVTSVSRDGADPG